MKIENIRLEETDQSSQVVATVTWEDCDRPQRDIYIATLPEYNNALSDKTDAFLTACSFVAARDGERRLKVEGTVCPILLEGANANLSWLFRKHKLNHALPVIEAQVDVRATPPINDCTALFLSGGIDSLFSLRYNRLTVPKDHSLSVKDVIHVQGAGFPEDPSFSLKTDAFAHSLTNLGEVADEAGVNLIPVLSNLSILVYKSGTPSDRKFWQYCYCAMALATVAHSFGKRVTNAIISSGNPISDIGSQELNYLSPNYSSQRLQIIYYGASFSRVQKTRIVSEWDVGFSHLHVCTKKANSNCGKCRKCLKTMTGLEALGKLKGSRAFPIDEVSPELLKTLKLMAPGDLSDYSSLISLLEERGRDDLVLAIQTMIKSYKPWTEWREEALQEIEQNIPTQATFILADLDEWGTDELVSERRRIPFLEKDGRYWGSPPNDTIAIAELERLKNKGASHLVIGWPAFWWLEHYNDFARHLYSNYDCQLENERLVIFKL